MSLAEDLFRLTFRDSPVGIAVLDHVGNYVNVNEAFAHALARDVHEINGRHFAEFTHPQDLMAEVEHMSKLAAGHIPLYTLTKRFLSPTGEVVWVRQTVSTAPAAANGRHVYVAHVQNVTAERIAREKLEQQTLYDPLTGLANRTLLTARLEAALRHPLHTHRRVAVAYIDVDHFKIVNDSLGHDAGDVVLRECARRILHSIRPGDTVARIGGDEFVVILDGVNSLSSAKGQVGLIAAALHQPMEVLGHEFTPSASIGIALSTDVSTSAGLIKQADRAMTAAKITGRSAIEVYADSMNETSLARLSLEQELRTAIREGQLVVHYQPVVDLQSRQALHLEALVRWRHPKRGLLLPEEFIDICEESNLMVALGAYVLHEACTFIAQNPEFTGRVFVNVSARQIGAGDLTRVLETVTAATGVPAARLTLELTETGMLMNSRAALKDMEGLQALGADLVLDDFGTGYSSFSSVLQNPVAGLKLAREFTMRLGDSGIGDRISSTLATLTTNLGMYGVIEGIETEAQYDLARAQGWTYGQGYLLAHPAPADQMSFLPNGAVQLDRGNLYEFPRPQELSRPAVDGSPQRQNAAPGAPSQALLNRLPFTS